MPPLPGRRVLVVEDEPFIAMTLEDMLTDFGCIVAGSVSQVSDALAVIALGQIDAAVLDVNLGAQKIDPVADELARLGFPFVFTTGYGRTGVPASHNKRGVVQKPFRAEELARTLARSWPASPANLRLCRNSNDLRRQLHGPYPISDPASGRNRQARHIRKHASGIQRDPGSDWAVAITIPQETEAESKLV